MMDSSRAADSCTICGGADWSLHHDQGDRKLFVCSGCRTIFAHPLPVWEEKAEIESNAFAGRVLQDTVKFFDHYGSDFQEDAVISAFRRSIERIGRFVAPGRLLDVGAGTGIFLHLCNEAGWQGRGIDIAAESAETAQREFGVEVDVGNFFTFDYELESFDCVSMNDVLEHSIDPVAFLERARSLLRPGGIVAVAVPNQESLLTRLVDLWVKWVGLKKTYLLDRLYVRPHLYFFGPSQLVRTIEAAGFEVDDFEGGHVALERYDIPFWMRVALEVTLRVGAMAGMGGRLHVIARKPD